MTPWAIRNYSVSGHLVLTSLWSGPSLYDGLNPQATGASNMEFFDEDNVMATMSEHEMNGHYSALAVQFARENPGRAAELAVIKMQRFLTPVPSALGELNPAIRAGCWLLWLLLFVPVLWACFRSPLLIRHRLLLLGPFVMFLCLHALFVGSIRYRLPVEYPLAVLAASVIGRFPRSTGKTGPESGAKSGPKTGPETGPETEA